MYISNNYFSFFNAEKKILSLDITHIFFQVVHVTYETMDAAREAAQRLNGYNLEGGILRVDRLMDRRRGPRGAMGGGPMGGGRVGGPGTTSPSQRHTDFPLRILVLSEMVGAIIGRQGSTIRTITQQV